ncbi:ribonuclease T2-like isoform X2 [Lates calcarifer]|uniref:Ribonuclease T2-like isoform X2 n=1 Tax=Lates calcarifer TaxID=8187 RepID=A0AAJ7PZJ8_LATCA|nr:ribonuclease T2-like isoform X2 [Lates calcarifer]
MRSSVLLGLLLLHLSVTSTQVRHWEEDYKYGRQDSELPEKKTCCSWKCLLFTLQWPGGFCQELEAELNEHWPSLITSKSSFHFWRDEWNKHGVCAACVEGMNSPPRYFQMCLKLRGQFNIHKLLEDAGITPSCERPYKVDEVRSVLAPHLGDKYEIQCVTDDKEREVWFQLKILLSHNLTLGCDHHHDTDWDTASSFKPKPSPTHHGHPCPPQVPFYYFPIDHQQPQQPCG